jgi:hypothetical protein
MERDQQRAAVLQMLDRLREVPGVAAVSAAEDNVLSRFRHSLSVPGARETIEATLARVTLGFFETMKIPVLAGRTFVRSDIDTDRPTVVVVNKAFARQYFGGEPDVARRFERWGGPSHAVRGRRRRGRCSLRPPASRSADH